MTNLEAGVCSDDINAVQQLVDFRADCAKYGFDEVVARRAGHFAVEGSQDQEVQAA